MPGPLYLALFKSAWLNPRLKLRETHFFWENPRQPPPKPPRENILFDIQFIKWNRKHKSAFMGPQLETYLLMLGYPKESVHPILNFFSLILDLDRPLLELLSFWQIPMYRII